MILTDICMPFLDGLELSDYVMRRFPNTKIILLTGYDTFEYAQKAVKLNVYDFILKPVTIDDLKIILSRVKADLENETRNKNEIRELKHKLNQSLPLLRERFLNKMVGGKINHQDMNNSLTYLGIGFKHPYYAVLVISVDSPLDLIKYNGEEKYHLILIAIAGKCMETLKEYELIGEIFNDNDDNSVVILNSQTEQRLKSHKTDIAEHIRQRIEQELNCTVTIGIGNNVKDISGLAVSYKNAVLVLDYRFRLGINQIIQYKDIIPKAAVQSVLNNNWANEIYYSLKTGNPVDTNSILERIFKSLKSEYIPMQQCVLFFSETGGLHL